MAKKSKAKVAKPKAVKTPAVRKVPLKPTEVLRVVAPIGVLPVIVHKEPGVVEIVPVPKTPPSTPPEAGGGWWNYLFGSGR